MSEDFAAAYEAHVWDVFGFFAYRTGNRSDAEDLTQQTFEKALRAWTRFDPERAPLGAWLMAIARNVLIDHYRADRTDRHNPIDRQPESALGTEGDPTDLGIAPNLSRALETLSDRDREVIALRFGADLSGRQIAELTGLGLANVQQILSRSLRKLRAALSSPPPSAERISDRPDDRRGDQQRQE
jgi:RNA polymerase sigma-70 factor, ECF subfamily